MSADDPRLAEIEAAANLIAERLAVAEPAVVEAVVEDSRAEVNRLRADRDSWKRMYDIAKARADRSEAEVEQVRRDNADAIARGAELARAFNAAGRPETSGPSLPDAAGGVGASPGADAPSRPPKHVWTCGLKFGDPTCECEAFSRS